MAHFERREWDQNTYYPEVAGVNLTQRFLQFMGNVALDGTELYTAWFIDEDHEEQITPDTARVFLSLIDDDSDCITVYDRRDNLWFNYMRHQDPESFQTVLQLVGPWATTTTSLTPMAEVYKRFIDASIRDTEVEDFHVPDDWL